MTLFIKQSALAKNHKYLKETVEISAIKLYNIRKEKTIKFTEGKIDMIIFFSDPLAAQPHDPDVKALLRIAQVYDIPMANNIATADFLMRSAYMEEEYSHKVENFKKTVERRAEEMN